MLECPSCGAKLIFMPRVHGLCHITPYSHWEQFPHVATERVTFSVGELSCEEGTHTAVYVKVLFPEREILCACAFTHAHTHVSTSIAVASLLASLWISLQIFPVSGLVPVCCCSATSLPQLHSCQQGTDTSRALSPSGSSPPWPLHSLWPR